MSAATAVSTTTAAPSYCPTCEAAATAAQSTTYIEYTTTYTWAPANWILSATQPVCTWQYHCLGDTCKTSDDCDHDWECRQGVCQPCCAPHAGHHLGTGATIGIGVAIPVCVAFAVGIFFLVWRAKRRKRRRYDDVQLNDDFGKPELEAPGVPLEDMSKRTELDPSPHPRAELSDNSEVAVEAASIEPVELEDTSSLGQQKYKGITISEPPTKGPHDNSEEVGDVLGMYNSESAVGVLPSPSLQTQSPSPTPDWPLPRQPHRSPHHSPHHSPPHSPYRSPHYSPRPSPPIFPRSPALSNFLLSPDPGSASINARSSPVSDLSTPRASEQTSHRLHSGSPMRMLPYGMIDRFDEDDDDDILPKESTTSQSSSYNVVPEQTRLDRRPDQPYHRHQWSPLPREDYPPRGQR